MTKNAKKMVKKVRIPRSLKRRQKTFSGTAHDSLYVVFWTATDNQSKNHGQYRKTFFNQNFCKMLIYCRNSSKFGDHGLYRKTSFMSYFALFVRFRVFFVQNQLLKFRYYTPFAGSRDAFLTTFHKKSRHLCNFWHNFRKIWQYDAQSVKKTFIFWQNSLILLLFCVFWGIFCSKQVLKSRYYTPFAGKRDVFFQNVIKNLNIYVICGILFAKYDSFMQNLSKKPQFFDKIRYFCLFFVCFGCFLFKTSYWNYDTTRLLQERGMFFCQTGCFFGRNMQEFRIFLTKLHRNVKSASYLDF